MSELDENSLESSGHWSDLQDNHSISGRARVRSQLEADIQAYLRRGGRIEQVGSNFCPGTSRKVEVGSGSRNGL